MEHKQLKISLTWMETPCLLGYLSTNSSLELHFQRNRSATPPPQSRWPQDPLAPAAWPLALAWLACHCWGPEFESNGESLMCYHAMKRGGFYWAKMRQTSLFHTGNGNIYGEPVRLHRFEVGTSRCQGWNTCTHRVQFSFRQACYMMLWTMIWTLIVR